MEEISDLVEQCQSASTSDKEACYQDLEIKITEAENLNVSDISLTRPREVLNEFEQTKYSKKLHFCLTPFYTSYLTNAFFSGRWGKNAPFI